MLDCPTCGAPLIAGARCALCEPGDGVEGFPPSIIEAGTDPATGDAMIKVQSPGVRSEARLKQADEVSLAVEGADEVGRAGEPQATRTLRQKLQADGLTVSVQPGRDDRGEDGLLSVGHLSYTLQFVTTPGVPDFWRDARAGTAMT